MHLTSITDVSYANEMISRIKLKSRTFITNYYESHDWFKKAVSCGKLLNCETENAAVILYKAQGFAKLFFFASSESALGEIIGGLEYPPEVIVCEIIDKKGFYKDIKRLLQEIRYDYYGGLVNISKIIGPEAKLDDKGCINIDYASEFDIESVIRLQHSMFNIYLDKHISEEEILDMVAGRQIFVSRLPSGEVTGFIIFSLKNMRSQLKYWAVDKKKATRGTGSALLRSLCLSLGDGARLDAWCRKDNIKALNLYKSKNFLETGLECDLFYYDVKGSGVEPLIPLN